MTSAQRSICTDCSNADSWGLPDKWFCDSCTGGSHWEPLNKSSVNPNLPPKGPDGDLLAKVLPAGEPLVSTWWVCPRCSYQQRGGPPGKCMFNAEPADCPLA